MFGYVHISPDKLTEEESARYRACYCGLCHTLGRRYGLAARMILNYDLVFLAMLLSEGNVPRCDEKRCPVHPIRRRCFFRETAALDAAADVSVLLTWWQLRDGVEDHGFFRGLKYRLSALLLRPAYRKARQFRPDLDKRMQERLQYLSALEREKCSVPDRAADAFALLLRDLADLENCADRRRVLEELLYHLGRWIYLVDALDDLKKDSRSGNYNPLLLRYGSADGQLSEQDKQRVAQTLDSSVRAMAAAFELADFGCWRSIIESVLYEGLYAVGSAVLNGTYRKKAKKTENAKGKAGPDDA